LGPLPFTLCLALFLVGHTHAGSSDIQASDVTSTSPSLESVDLLFIESDVPQYISPHGSQSRRTGSGSGSGSGSGQGSGQGSGSGSGSTLAPTLAPTLPPTGAPTTSAPTTSAPTNGYVAPETTIDINNLPATVETITQAVSVTLQGGAAAYIGATKVATEYGYGSSVGIMDCDAQNVCTLKTGTSLTSVATNVRRAAVTITFTVYVDSATSSVTMATVTASTVALAADPTILSAAITAVIASNPALAGASTPTVIAIGVATAPTSPTAAASDDDDDNTGVIVGAVVGSLVAVAAVAGIAFFFWKKNSNSSPAKVEPFDQQVGVRAQ